MPIMVPQPLPDHKTPPAAPLTWGEQQEALILLRSWHETHRGGINPPAVVVQMTALLLHDHPART